MRENKPQSWYQGVSRYAWLVLVIAALGWLFDTMDQNLFNLVRQPSVTALLRSHTSPEQVDGVVKYWSGLLTAIFLLGWAAGGFIFGSLGDKIGRSRTLIYTILIYAIFTGLNGFASTIELYALCRFLSALGVGGEFAAGAALVAETWPDRSRPMALGFLQASSAVGNMLAAGINFVAGADWRLVYFIGAAPALLVVFIRAAIHEPEQWKAAKEAASRGSGKALGSIRGLFQEPVLRKNTIAGLLLASAGVGGLWGVGFFLPDLTGTVLHQMAMQLPEGLRDGQLARWRSEVFFLQQVGGFFGMISYAAVSERSGRKPVLAVFLALAFLSVQGAFWGIHDLNSARWLGLILGFCTLAPFSAYAVYFPELFPTRLRSTGVGFCYNGARLLAASAPFLLGSFSRHFFNPAEPSYGLRVAASLISLVYLLGIVGLILAPETKGKPLPE